MPYSSLSEMRRRAARIREMAATFADPEMRRLILAQAEKLAEEANRIERGESLSNQN